MSFEKKRFFELFNGFLPVEKAVFAETLYDLMELNYRKKYFLPKGLRSNAYWLQTIPDNRKLSKRIEETYDLRKRKHRRAYIEKLLLCLGLLKAIGVIDFSKFTYSLFHPRHKLITIHEENLKELLGIWKNVDKETFQLPLYEIVYSEPAILLKGVEEKIANTRYESQAELVFEYVYNHPNRDISIDEINDYIEHKLKKGKVTRDLDDIFKDIGFRENLGKVFLKKKTSTIVHLRNPVYFVDLKEIGIEYCEPAELLSKDKRKSKTDVVTGVS